jgi:hypothetical protein
MPELFLSSSTLKQADRYKFGLLLNETQFMQEKEIPSQYKSQKAAMTVQDVASKAVEGIKLITMSNFFVQLILGG